MDGVREEYREGGRGSSYKYTPAPFHKSIRPSTFGVSMHTLCV